jgi:hypothetical protein
MVVFEHDILYNCPYCRQSIKDNSIFNTGINKIFLKNNLILELCKQKQLGIFENEFNISKYNLIKMILLEYITNKPNVNDTNINKHTEHIQKKKNKKSRKDKLFKRDNFLGIIIIHQNKNKKKINKKYL